MQLTYMPRILIVEDDPAVAEMVATLLESHWYRCMMRRSGAQGIHAFAENEVDLIITDLNMAAGDGVALIEAIRRTSRTPVIVITGFAPEYADRVRLLENVAVISKPFDSQVLFSTVDGALDAADAGASTGNDIAALHRIQTQ